MRRAVGGGLAALVALVVAGFILGGYLDASGVTSIPGVGQLMRLPKVVRILIELVIGVPIAFGIALYFILETANCCGSWARRSGGCLPTYAARDRRMGCQRDRS